MATLERIYPNGIGELTGDPLVTRKPLNTNVDIWFVDSVTGDDTYDGRNRVKPFATLGQAVTDSANGDIIVMLETHAETFTSTLTISKSLTIIGAGRDTSGRPTVKLTNNQSSGNMLLFSPNIEVCNQQLRGVWIEENAQANSDPRIAFGVSGDNNPTQMFRMFNCYVECGGTDEGTAVELNYKMGIHVKDTAFMSTATSVTDQPLSAIAAGSDDDSDGATYCLWIDGVTIDGGTHGFSNFWALDLRYVAGGSDYQSVENIHIEDLSLLNGADARLMNENWGYMNPSTTTDDIRIEYIENLELL